MKVVKHKITGRLIHRTAPDFKDGDGIKSALFFYSYPESELEESTCTEEEWLAEIALRQEESPLTINELLDTRRDNPQRTAYKASQLYGLTHEQLDNIIDGVSNLAEAKEVLRKALHVVLYLVKQTKLDE